MTEPRELDRVWKAPRRSEDVEEVLASIPPGVLGAGIWGIGCVLIVLLVASAFIHYPETVTGRVTLVGRQPPVPVVARTDAKIVHLLVSENERVSIDQTIAVLQSTGQAEDLLALDRAVRRCDQDRPDNETLRATLDEPWALGELQDAHGRVLTVLDDIDFFDDGRLYDERLAAIDRILAAQGGLEASLRTQAKIQAEREELVTTRKRSDADLALRGVLSRLQVQERELERLRERLASSGVTASEIGTQIEQLALKRAQVEIAAERETEARRLDRELDSAWQALCRAVAGWRYQYVLQAPTPGRVAFFDVWVDNQMVRSGHESIFIVPDSPDTVGRMKLGQSGSGRVRPGQTVQIRLDSHPVHQFGFLYGRVESISRTAKEDEYSLIVDLARGLETSFGRKLDFRQGMTGTAVVITRDRSVLDRLFGPIRYALDVALSPTSEEEHP